MEERTTQKFKAGKFIYYNKPTVCVVWSDLKNNLKKSL